MKRYACGRHEVFYRCWLSSLSHTPMYETDQEMPPEIKITQFTMLPPALKWWQSSTFAAAPCFARNWIVKPTSSAPWRLSLPNHPFRAPLPCPSRHCPVLVFLGQRPEAAVCSVEVADLDVGGMYAMMLQPRQQAHASESPATARAPFAGHERYESPSYSHNDVCHPPPYRTRCFVRPHNALVSHKRLPS